MAAGRLDPGIVRRGIELARPVKRNAERFELPPPDRGRALHILPRVRLQAGDDFLPQPVAFTKRQQFLRAMAGHRFPYGEIKAVEIGARSPSRMRSQSFDCGLEVPIVQSPENQATEKDRDRMFAERAAEIEACRNAEALERCTQERKIRSRFAQRDADLTKWRAAIM